MARRAHKGSIAQAPPRRSRHSGSRGTTPPPPPPLGLFTGASQRFAKAARRGSRSLPTPGGNRSHCHEDTDIQKAVALQEGRPDRLGLPLTRGRYRSLGGSQAPPQAARPPSQKQILWRRIASFCLQPRRPLLHVLLPWSRAGLSAERDAGTVQKAHDMPTPLPKSTSSAALQYSLPCHATFLKFKTKSLSSATDSGRLSVEISSDERPAALSCERYHKIQHTCDSLDCKKPPPRNSANERFRNKMK